MPENTVKIYDRVWSLAIGLAGTLIGGVMLFISCASDSRDPRTAEVNQVAGWIGFFLAVLGVACLRWARPLRFDGPRRAFVRANKVVLDLTDAGAIALWTGQFDESSSILVVTRGDSTALCQQLIARDEAPPR